MLPGSHIKANGKVDIFEHHEDGSVTAHEMWATDAKHALETDPDRWKLHGPAPVDEGEGGGGEETDETGDE